MKEKLTFREAQLGAYDVLKFIDQLSEQLHLTYFLTYGSMLGAIRNGGVIPWDDDIDIMMPRPDYDRLIAYCGNNMDKIAPYKLFENSLVPDYPHSIARMSNQNYWIDFDNEKNYGIGLFVDIYPLDGVGNDYQEARKRLPHASHLTSLCFLTSRKKFGWDNTRSALRMLVKVPAYIWANLMGNAHYIKKLNKLSGKYSYEDSKYIACMEMVWREGPGDKNKNIYEKSLLDVIRVPFEDGMFPVPKAYHEFLTNGYGDYMTPPPEDERKTHHTYDTYRIK